MLTKKIVITGIIATWDACSMTDHMIRITTDDPEVPNPFAKEEDRDTSPRVRITVEILDDEHLD